MKIINKKINYFIRNPLFQVISTWLWFFLGAALTVLIILLVHGVNFSEAYQVLGDKRYLAVYIEIVSVGLLPVIYTLINKEKLKDYGIRREKLINSLLLSLFFMLIIFGINWINDSRIITYQTAEIDLLLPWNLWYALLGIFAYGPLEVFFVFWLIKNTDRVFKSKDLIFSWGLIITVLLFGLVHLITTQSITNAFNTAIIFFMLGLIYKYFGNAIGPKKIIKVGDNGA